MIIFSISNFPVFTKVTVMLLHIAYYVEQKYKVKASEKVQKHLKHKRNTPLQ